MRALMARTLLEKHQMKEKQAAQLLGISQSAVSKYSRRVRGTTLPIQNNGDVQTIVDQMINLLLHEPGKKTEVMKLFCHACTLIRKKGLMCPFCQRNASETKTESCDFCTFP